uniref:Uncharacterized protein n=1 Tax=Arundo donax TaxID=35708 RepID=A0A0A9AZ53_ARUDO
MLNFPCVLPSVCHNFHG